MNKLRLPLVLLLLGVFVLWQHLLPETPPSSVALQVAQEATESGISPEMLEAGAEVAHLDMEQQHFEAEKTAAQGIKRAGTGIELWGFSLVLDTAVARALFFLVSVLVDVSIVGIAYLLLRREDAHWAPALFWALVVALTFITLVVWSILLS